LGKIERYLMSTLYSESEYDIKMDPKVIARLNEYMYSIVLPTYNEADNVVPMIQKINHYMRGYNWELIIVDDNSPDGTYFVACEESQNSVYSNRVKVLFRDCKLGLGSAYKYAMQYVRGQWVVFMDADLSHDPKYIPGMIKCQIATNTDIINGTREEVQGWSYKRYMLSYFANTITRLLLGSKRSDLTGSFRLYRVQALRKLLHTIQSNGYAFQIEAITKAEDMNYKVIDYPYTFINRTAGNSKLGISDCMGFAYILLSMYAMKKYQLYQFICQSLFR
jgi:dolichol-phosphate mannosyltransferase